MHYLFFEWVYTQVRGRTVVKTMVFIDIGLGSMWLHLSLAVSYTERWGYRVLRVFINLLIEISRC